MSTWEVRDILDTTLRDGILVKIGTNGLLCLWLSCWGIQVWIRQNVSCIVGGVDTLCEVQQGGDRVCVAYGINIWNLTWYV